MKYERARIAKKGFYHTGKSRLSSHILEEKRPFIAWDGEGVNLRGEGKPQSYVLFGSSAEAPLVSDKGLSTWECLEHIIDVGQKHPDAIHVAFSFGYDSNMIVQGLALSTLSRLHRRGITHVKHDGWVYVITYRKSKYFQVTKRLENFNGQSNRSAAITVRIYDLFTFFMRSFVKAYNDLIGPLPDVVTTGKGNRQIFSVNELDEIQLYWSHEIQAIRELAEELRRRVYKAKLYIKEWHGPGALGSFALKEHGIKNHMERFDDEIREAARYAYAAGRFEPYGVGRFQGPVYGIDINSAYPFALTQLPSLANGHWRHLRSPNARELQAVGEFSLWKVDMRQGGMFQAAPSPLYHRDKKHELSFPWHTRGWYWGPEARRAWQQNAEVHEVWEFVPVERDSRPFRWISSMYDLRKQWKADGNTAEYALKICMNSMYGKLAQRVGYDAETGRIPGWHQLEWAGWVTSRTRATLFDVLSRIPQNKLIAVETDGIYTTESPESLGITASKELGGWSVDVYEEAIYVQSGLAWLRKGDCPRGCLHDRDARDAKTCQWEQKRRGLDPSSFELNDCLSYVQSLKANEPWKPFQGLTTRFTSMGQAMQTREPMMRHCVWVTAERQISVGRKGKRIHVPQHCPACHGKADAYELPHRLVINPRSILTGTDSYPHDIPWENDDDPGVAEWREQDDDSLFA